MTVTIQIENETVQVKSGISTRTQKPYEIREQSCIVHGVGRFPLETRITLPDTIEGYKVGHYEVTTPLTVGRFGLDVSRDLGLVQIKTSARSAA